MKACRSLLRGIPALRAHEFLSRADTTYAQRRRNNGPNSVQGDAITAKLKNRFLGTKTPGSKSFRMLNFSAHAQTLIIGDKLCLECDIFPVWQIFTRKQAQCRSTTRYESHFLEVCMRAKTSTPPARAG